MIRHIRWVVHACLVFMIIPCSILFVLYIPNYHIDKFKLSRKDWFHEQTSTAAIFNSTRNLKKKSSYMDYARFGLYKNVERMASLTHKTRFNQRSNGSLLSFPKLNSGHRDVSLQESSINDRKFESGHIKTVVVKTGNGTDRSRGHGHGQRHASDDVARLDRKRPNYCPLWPQELVGRLSEDSFHASPLASRTREAVDSGGQYRPGGCVPREKVAVIIPYRDREQNLKVQLHHLHSVLQRQNLQYGIYVVEMAYPTPFNRGLLANVGFLVASDVIPYTCYVIHDVDLLVMDDRNLYRCGRVPRHLLAHSTKYGKLPYVAYFGGVVALKERHLRAVNGFSNLYFGWGGEDDDLLTRDILLKSAKERMFKDGISSVQYTLLALEKRPLFTWVYIAVNETDIPKKFQEYFQR